MTQDAKTFFSLLPCRIAVGSVQLVKSDSPSGHLTATLYSADYVTVIKKILGFPVSLACWVAFASLHKTGLSQLLPTTLNLRMWGFTIQKGFRIYPHIREKPGTSKNARTLTHCSCCNLSSLNLWGSA